MITNLYRWFANQAFRMLIPPDDGPAYFLNQVWRNEVFTNLFFLFLILSLSSAAFYYFYLNGKKMPAVFDQHKHWWNMLLINLGLNFLAVILFLLIAKLPTGNNLYCLSIGNALFGTIAFSFFSLFLQFFSPSAKGIPVGRRI